MVREVKEYDPELRKVQVLNTKMKDERSLLDRLTKFSDWKRAVKAIARLKRHAKQIKGYKPKESEATSIEERQEAELFIIKLVQGEAFSSEIKRIKAREGSKTQRQSQQATQMSMVCSGSEDV